MFDFTLQCEIQTATGRLPDLVWSQGTTPLILAVPTRKGARIGADSGTVARMMIATTPTSETWAVVESTGTAEDGYLLQWPTVGAHTEKDKPWFYTVYFMRDGHRYWTGSGLLWIEETSATGDGLVWQEVATWEDMVGEVVDAVEDKDFDRLTLNGETITRWPGPGTSGVSSVNGITGPVTLAPGDNVAINKSGSTLTIAVTGGGGGWPENPFTEATQSQSVPGAWQVLGDLTFEGDLYLAQSLYGIDATMAAMTLGGVKRTSWPSTTVNGEDGPVRLLPGSNVSITPNGKDFTISATGGGGSAETARIITTATATVGDGDTLILMDTATAGQAQTLTLPASMTAAAMTVTVRQLGTAGVTISHGANEYHLTYDGDWVTLDWISGEGWFWRA